MVVISYCILHGSIKETTCAYYPKLITQSAAMLVACSFSVSNTTVFFPHYQPGQHSIGGLWTRLMDWNMD